MEAKPVIKAKPAVKAMILAAGRGTRMAPLTDHCPKPLVELAGKPLIVHHIEKLVAAGFRDIVINHAYLGHLLEQRLGDGSEWGARIEYSAEAQALETGGGIFQALPLLATEADNSSEQPFLIINGDVWSDVSSEALRQAVTTACDTMQASKAEAFLWLVTNPEHNLNGDFVLTEEGKVLDNSAAERYTFAGISLLTPQLFSACQPGAFALAPLLRQAMARNSVAGQLLAAQWVDVGTPQRLQQTEELIAAAQEMER